MKPKPNPRTHEQPMIGTMRLELTIDMDHELVRLAQAINWDAIAVEFRPMYCPNNGRPAVPTRLMAGLQLLKHTFNLSDEQVVTRWTENPYWQFSIYRNAVRYSRSLRSRRWSLSAARSSFAIRCRSIHAR